MKGAGRASARRRSPKRKLSRQSQMAALTRALDRRVQDALDAFDDGDYESSEKCFASCAALTGSMLRLQSPARVRL